jgi:putative glycosyltransferase (TIGR04372 family)
MSFLQQNISMLKVGGVPVFYQKSYSAIKWLMRKCLLAVGFIMTTPIVLIVVLIRPFVLIRFGNLRGERIGHFSADTEAYLCILDHEKSVRRIDIVGCPKPICNHYLKQMWERTFLITPGAWLWSRLDQSCQFWTRGERHHVKLAGMSVDYKHILATPPHLSFTKEEEQRGQELLEQLGIPLDAPWICIHNRDSAYLDQVLTTTQWIYHDYRDFSIQSMISAAEELTKRGYFVIRMGSIQSEILSTPNHMIVDYACSPNRSEFGDIYLSSGCSAYLGSDSGIFCLSLIFRKPISFVNYSLTIADLIPKRACNLFLPFITKQLFHKEKQCFLSLREMFELGLYSVGMSHKFEEAGVEAISNTPEEICNLAIEVDQRLKGQWQPNPEDESLQKRFWDIYRQHGSRIDQENMVSSPIGSEFLRQHRYLLE